MTVEPRREVGDGQPAGLGASVAETLRNRAERMSTSGPSTRPEPDQACGFASDSPPPSSAPSGIRSASRRPSRPEYRELAGPSIGRAEMRDRPFQVDCADLDVGVDPLGQEDPVFRLGHVRPHAVAPELQPKPAQRDASDGCLLDGSFDRRAGDVEPAPGQSHLQSARGGQPAGQSDRFDSP